jgi:tRNA threonylcarbamoyladenosine biosynthesis protein TsaB
MADPRATGGDRRAPVVLGFDTAGSACSVAVGRVGAVLADEWQEMRHGHAEALLPMIDRVVNAAGLDPSAIDRIAVSVGPGGFTGIRAGLAAAHGLALATGAQLVGVSSFAAVSALLPETEGVLLVALDSRREDPYVQLFVDGIPSGEAAAVPPDDLARFVDAAIGDTPLRIAGDAAEAAAAVLGTRLGVTLIGGTAPQARGVLAAAECSALVTEARALYVRAPDVSFPKQRQPVGGRK